MSTSKWSKEKANQWYEKNGWLLGCNYAPSTAVNQLEMWEADTFDPETIERELAWAEPTPVPSATQPLTVDVRRVIAERSNGHAR